MGDSKILTIAVCAYNMEKYLADALQSLAVPEISGLEVIVLDDGSEDDTLAIAKGYADRYPDIFKVVSKENGGWGSNINLAVGIARGEYFKILDADDWVDSVGLSRLIADCNRYKGSVDLLVNPHVECIWDERSSELVSSNLSQILAGCPKNTVLSTEDESAASYFVTWNATFRTSCLKGGYVSLPCHTLYGDNLYMVHALSNSSTMLYLEYPVYCYRTGRDEQSTSFASLLRHRDDLGKILRLMLARYLASTRSKPIVKTYMGAYIYATYYRTALMALSAGKSKEVRKELVSLRDLLFDKCPEIHEELHKYRLPRLHELVGYRCMPLFHAWISRS